MPPRRSECRVERIPGERFVARYCDMGAGNVEIDIEEAKTGESVGVVALTRARLAQGPGRSHGRCAFSIEWIESQRRGVGTKLYELGLAAARRVGCTLASDTTRSPYAESFWRKQEGKGRAHCEGDRAAVRGGEVFWPDDILEEARRKAGGAPLPPHERALKLKHFAVQAIPAGLPRPKFRPDLGRYRWPCNRYVLNTPAPRSLSALGRVRTSR